MDVNRTGDGRYTFSKLEQPCVCGHELGVHTAERAKVRGVWFQECLAEGCGCDCFVKPRRKKGAAATCNPVANGRGGDEPPTSSQGGKS